MTSGGSSVPGSDVQMYRTYVYPFVLFMGFTLLLSIVDTAVRWEHPDAPWWQQAPEMFIYPVQTLVCAGYLWHIRRGAEWGWSLRTAALGAVFGTVGIAAWLVPYFTGWIPADGGFSPERIFPGNTAAITAEYVLRFARAVAVVPLVEEFFWRGFLMRWCVDRDFPQRVAFGTPGWIPYIVTTVAFMAVHAPADYAGAFVYGTLAYYLTVRTRRLASVVVMHAVANLIMGLCAVYGNMPHLW